MAKCETATASIGIRILLSNLIPQINKNNFLLIKEMLTTGYIEDGNDYYNESFDKVMQSTSTELCLFDEDCEEVKEYFITSFKNFGSEECLFEKAFVLPINEILTNSRWGYDRYGTNCIARTMDFGLSVDIEKYKHLEHIEIVFLLRQQSF